IRHFIKLLLLTTVTALITREKLVSGSIEQTSLSPDGKVVGFIALDKRKIRNVFIWTISERQKRQVTFEESNVKSFEWTGVKDVIIFTKDITGDENFAMFTRNISKAAQPENVVISKKLRVKARTIANDKKKEFILIGMNDVNPSYYNVYKYDIIGKQLSLALSNSRFHDIHTDNNLKIRLATEVLDDGTTVFFRPSGGIIDEVLTSDIEQWEELFRLSSVDSLITKFLRFDSSNENIYWIWGEESDLGNVVIAPAHDITQRRVLYFATCSEIEETFFNPEDHTIISISANYHTPQRVFVDESIAEDISSIDKSLSHFLPSYQIGLLNILDISLDFNTWLITYYSAEASTEVFVYNRSEKSLERLFDTAPGRKGYTVGKPIGFSFTASDGLTIQSYLSLPTNVPLKTSTDVSEELKEFADRGMIPEAPQKMVLLVHGGPSSRDKYHFLNIHALLTSRGYAVLQVNFRGSIGFGKKFHTAGWGEWSRKMHSDLIEAVEFAVTNGIANRSAIAIVATPDTFACGIDLFGPSNLITLLKAIPPTWKSGRAELIMRMGGDPETEEGRRELAARSPLFIADRVKKPLLIMQGANDARVKQDESDQFVAALSNHSIPFTYVLYRDEGHGFKRTPNKLAELGHIEKFLHECLGGEYQPFLDGEYGENAVVRTEGATSRV
ncbi:hypothetical protein PMAYCL1PPCAC_28025, partial [Pristionchus mayeri]